MGGTRGSGLGARDSGVESRIPSPEPRIPAPRWDDMVLVGRVARPHGLRGQVIVEPETDFVEERFCPGAVFWTRSANGDETLTVCSARLQGRRPVIALEGFRTVDDAARLAGLELRIPEEALKPLAHGRYYQHQLVGCAVETMSGAPVGEVARVSGGVAGSVLAIDGPRGEILIPLAAEICVDVDVDARRIKIEPPSGLLDLNETRRSKGSRQ